MARARSGDDPVTAYALPPHPILPHPANRCIESQNRRLCKALAAVLILYCDGTDVIQLAGLVATINDIRDVVITAAASEQMPWFNGSSQSTRTAITTWACSSPATTP